MREKRTDGGAAFPRPPAWNPGYEPTCTPGQQGMSMLDWFAGMAMQGMLACPYGENDKLPRNIKKLEDWPPRVSAIAYQYAEAMLAERERRMKATECPTK